MLKVFYKSLILSLLLLVSVYLFIEISGVRCHLFPCFLASMNVFNYTRHCVCSVIDGVGAVFNMFRYGVLPIDHTRLLRFVKTLPQPFRSVLFPYAWYNSQFVWVLSKILSPLLWTLRAGYVSFRDLSIVFVEINYLLGKRDNQVSYRSNAKGFFVFRLKYFQRLYDDYLYGYWQYVGYTFIASVLVQAYVPLFVMKTCLFSIAARIYMHDKLTVDNRSLLGRVEAWFTAKFYGFHPVQNLSIQDSGQSYWTLVKVVTKESYISSSVNLLFRNGRMAWEAKGWNAKMHALFGNIDIPRHLNPRSDTPEEEVRKFMSREYDRISARAEYYISHGMVAPEIHATDFDRQDRIWMDLTSESDSEQDEFDFNPTRSVWDEDNEDYYWLTSGRYNADRRFPDDYPHIIEDFYENYLPMLVFSVIYVILYLLYMGGRPLWLANIWNKFMHSLNGNIDFFREEVDYMALLAEEEVRYYSTHDEGGYVFQNALRISDAPIIFHNVLYLSATLSELIRGIKDFIVKDLRELAKFFGDNKDFSFMNCSCIYLEKLITIIINRKTANMFIGTCDNGKQRKVSAKITGEIHKYDYKYVRDPFYMVEPIECPYIKLLPAVVSCLSDAQKRLRHKSFVLSKQGKVKVGVCDAGIVIMQSISMSPKRVRDLYAKVSFYYPSNKGYDTNFSPVLLSDYIPLTVRENYVVCGIEMKHTSDMECIMWGRNNGFRNQIYSYITDPIGDMVYSQNLQQQLNSACANGRLKLDSSLWSKPKVVVEEETVTSESDFPAFPTKMAHSGELNFQAGLLEDGPVPDKFVGFSDIVRKFGGNDVAVTMVDNGIELASLLAFFDLIYTSDSMFRVFEVTLLYVRNMKFPISLIEEIDTLSSRNIGVVFQAGGLSFSLWENLQFSTLLELYRIFSKISWFSLMKLLPDIKLGGYSLKMPITEMSKSTGFFSSLARVVVHFLEKIKECFKSGSLSPLLNRFSSPSSVHKRIMNLSVYSTLLCGYNASARQKRELADLIKQEIVDEEYKVMMTPILYAEEVGALHSACKELLVQWENDLPSSILLKDSLKTAELLLSKIRMRALASSGRKQPYGLVLYGSVGVGKSELRNMIHATACNVLGVPAEGTVAIWTDTNFQDTYNDMCITVMMDDIDHSMHYSEFNHAKAIKQCIGVEPQYIESARVEDKGNTFASHQLVIYITNHVALNLNGFTTMKGAIFRRLPIYAEIKLNPLVHQGPMMPGFVSDKGMNIHIIDLYKYSAEADPNFPYSIFLENLDTKDFLRWFRSDFERYTLLKPLDDCVKCVCGVHSSVCCCEPWGGPSSLQSGFYVDLSFLAEPVIISLMTSLLFVVIIECYLKVLKGKTLYYYKELKTFISRLYLLFYYLQGSSLKLVEYSRILCQEHLSRYMTLTNVALAGCVAAAIVYWNAKTSKFHEQMGMTISTDGTFRRVAMAPQTFAFTNTHATWTKNELVAICQQRIVKIVHRDADKEGKKPFVHAMRYGVDLLLVPSHVITSLITDDSVLEVWAGTQKIAFTKRSVDFEMVHDTVDLCVMRAPQLAMGTSIEKHIYHSFPSNISQFDSAEFVTEDGIFPVATRTSVYDHKVILLSDGVVSKGGDCGLPIIAADKNSWRIVGMHFAANVLKYFAAPTCFADKLEKSRIDEAIQRLGMRSLVLEPISLQFGNLPIGPTPLTSSVGAYLGTGATNISYIGTLQGMRTSTFKSNLQLSPVYPYFKDIITEFCGEPLPFVIPSVKGSLDNEGYWRDAFTERMQDPMPESFPDEDCCWLAVADYLSGTLELASQITVPDVLSLHEAFVGNADMFVTPTNMSTSAGPPFNRPKSTVVIPFREGLSPPLYYDFIPQAAELHTNFVDTLTENTSPLLFSTVFVKDEPVKQAKQFLPRLINNLPFSYNLLMKIHMVGPRNLLRRFPVHYECMVGINIGSNHVCRITGNLIDKGGKVRTFEYDFRWFDLTQRGIINFHVSNVFYGLSFHISGPINAKLLHNLVTSGFKVVYCFKGDLISFGCHNPSGGDGTVEINSIANSVALRYAYYRATGITREHREWVKNYKLNFFSKPVVVLPTTLIPFRSQVAASTYGDDGVAASRLDIGSWLNKYVAELGMCITDGRDKSPLVKPRPLHECTFLKREFTYDPELEYMLMPLKKEAILRMVMYLLPSALTNIDHMATVCNDVLKEASLHGEEFYNRIAVLVLQASIAEKFSDSAYLKVKTFQERRQELLSGDFVTWSRGMENGVSI